MTVESPMPLRDVKNRLSEVVDQVDREHDRVVITRHGRPAAVVLSTDDLESLEEALAILGDPDQVAAVRVGMQELDDGKGETLSKEEILAELRRD